MPLAQLPHRWSHTAGGRQSAEAVAVCRQCPVQSDCLQYALKHGIKDGVSGGTTERERMRMLRMRPREPAA